MMAEVAHVVPSSAGCRNPESGISPSFLRRVALIQVDINHNGPSRGHHVDIALARGHSVDIHLDARDHHVRAPSPTLPCEHLSVTSLQTTKPEISCLAAHSWESGPLFRNVGTGTLVMIVSMIVGTVPTR